MEVQIYNPHPFNLVHPLSRPGPIPAFLWYDLPTSKIKYRGGLQKVPRYFNKTTAVVFTKYRGTFPYSNLDRTIKAP